MSTSSDKKENESSNSSAIKPDPETLHTTDPQEHMEGPLSSLMQSTGKDFDKKETPEEADDSSK